MRKLWKTLAALLILALVATGWVVYQHDYALREERVEIGDLRAVLARPRTGDRHGLVVFVHGDGPVDATHDTFYRPLWEAFARAGYASLSWDKPGVAGAPGNWLHQSMADRADEVRRALAWARTRPEVDPDRVGLWGASQAGWVMPAVAADTDVAFVIAVGTAVNWLRQGRYNLLAELPPGEDPEAALARRETRLDLVRRNVSFEEYRNATGDREMTPDRWRFVLANHRSDATADLARVRAPVLLLLGEHDRNVDIAETETTYRRLIGDLEVHRYPNATHGLTRDTNDLVLAATAVAAPRALFAPGVLDDQVRFLERVR
ncbi:CocE/NonD family hydrolase [Saccharothrix mutabilis subsp. mutabilis]|uniref:CocE/NonD family hydrolase n=1 Tax=Saccharothrix mutabilis subsp. mutabilis TaxID=66855 RepID=A0ABN0T2E9_9PSEU